MFLEEYKKTLGVDFLQKKHIVKELENEEVEFYIWDTAGQEEYDSLTRRYYKGASACVIAFSTTDRESFNHIEKWKKAVEGKEQVLIGDYIITGKYITKKAYTVNYPEQKYWKPRILIKPKTTAIGLPDGDME